MGCLTTPRVYSLASNLQLIMDPTIVNYFTLLFSVCISLDVLTSALNWQTYPDGLNAFVGVVVDADMNWNLLVSML
jgi:hypothetical protein